MNYRSSVTPRCQTCARPLPAQSAADTVCENVCAYPIAMAYVPVQTFQTTYNLQQSLEVGTIFPELHKPFCGKRWVR